MEHYTVRRVASFDECEGFVRNFGAGSKFSDPMLSNGEQVKDNLIKAIEKTESHTVIGIFRDRQMVGLFSFLSLRDERYLEMLAGFSDDEKAYGMMYEYLSEHFASYDADFVLNPNNDLLAELLRQKGAGFETEQQKMVFAHPVPDTDMSGVELLTEPYVPSYLDMHSADMYWTGEKVIGAKDRFRTLIAIENGRTVGYVDVTYCFEENEPYDLRVREEYRGKGYGRKLLAKALEMNRPKGMALLVDIDNQAAIRLYESLGFEKAENRNSITAHLKIQPDSPKRASAE